MGIYDPIRTAAVDQLLRWWHGMDPPHEGFEDDYLDEVAYCLSEAGPPWVTALKQSLDSDDTQRRRAAIYFLARPSLVDEEIRTALLRAFRARELALKTAALWGLMHLDYFPLDPSEVERLMRHEDERIAALAMCSLSRAFPDETIMILRAGLRTKNPRMREYACDEIGDREIIELSAEMRPLVGDEDSDVAQAARSNLEWLPSETPDQGGERPGA